MLKAVLDSLDGLAPEIAKFYEEGDDGKFYLQVDGADNLAGVKKLKAAHERTKTERTELRTKLTEAEQKLAAVPEDFDADKWAEYKALEEADGETDPKKKKTKVDDAALQNQKKNYETRIASIEAKAANDLAEKDKIIAAKDRYIEGLLVDGGLTEALVAAGVAKPFLKAAKAMLRNSVKVVEEDGEYKAVIDTNLGPEKLPDFVATWVKSDEGQPFIDKGTGGDANGSKSKQGTGVEANPWKKETLNLTEQGRIINKDRVKAERMMKDAGLSQFEINKVLRPQAA